MPLPSRRGGPAVVAAVLGAALLIAGCDAVDPSPAPSSASPSAPRPFTVMSTDAIRTTDPAAVTDAASAMLSLNVFQRLMTAPPGEQTPKPDAAKDCLFTTTTTYTCTLNKDMQFVNGDALTSSDVKFSIQRAIRLAVPGSSAGLFSSLRRIETPDDLTVRFVLSQQDTQFVWALASPAASIVDEQVYDADEVRANDRPVVGSGPFGVTSFSGGVLSLGRFRFYVGFNPAREDTLVYRTAADSATIEDAMAKGRVDAVWRGLDAAAVTRYGGQVAQNADKLTSDGFTMTDYTGLRVKELFWSPSSSHRSNKALRQAIAVSLQGDRTLQSVIPGGIPGHITAFPAGGKATPKVTWKRRISLTLSYSSTDPDARDQANQIRTRLEDTGGMSIRVRADDARADLSLVDYKAWTATPLAWLQPYLASPLPESATKIDTLVEAFRQATEPKQADALLAQLQRQAAQDLTILPISQADEYSFSAEGTDIAAASFGPGWQLGYFGMGKS
ncbi:ABC transporter substrate-binding protein [Microlunatus ginsengisoli]|uniref:ABC transporter substrate-binding protein n=1 Tax=Microlunatus ginsengisoli TaxID=363863 RepID=UPI0031D54E56